MKSNERSSTVPSIQVGRYRLLTQLGASGFGERWVGAVVEGAEQGRLVTVRRLSTEGIVPSALRTLTRAGILAMSMRHPKVAAVLDVIVEGGQLALVSEYVDAEPLRSLQTLAAKRGAPLPPPVVVAILIDTVSALRAAHEQWASLPDNGADVARSISGGITPDSVVVATFGDAMLSDVGVAGALAQVPQLLRHSALLPYRAPEQLSPRKQVTEQSDVYSIGVLAWELFTNQPLFGGSERLHRLSVPELEPRAITDLERDVRGGTIKPLREMRREGSAIHDGILLLVERALMRKPEQRFDSLAQLETALRSLPADTIASTEQVAATVERLARTEIETRRAAIEMGSSVRAHSDSGPPSGRPTGRPPTPEVPVRIAAPRLKAPSFGGLLTSRDDDRPSGVFSPEEAPTARRMTPGRGAKPAQPEGAAEGEGAASPPRAPAKPPPPPRRAPAPQDESLQAELLPESSVEPLEERSAESSPALAMPIELTAPEGAAPTDDDSGFGADPIVLPKSPRRTWLWATLAGVLVAAAALAAWSQVNPGDATARPTDPTTDPVASAPPVEPTQATDPEPSAEPIASEEPVAPEPSGEAQPESSAERPRAAPAAPRPVRTAPAQGGKPYRPKGI